MHKGNFKTKLEDYQVGEVIRGIERKIRDTGKKAENEKKIDCLKKQLTVYNLSQFNLNLIKTLLQNKRDENPKSITNTQINNILEAKRQDFELCKVVDEESLGCATTSKSTNFATKSTSKTKSFLDKKLEQYKKVMGATEKAVEKQEYSPKLVSLYLFFLILPKVVSVVPHIAQGIA